MNNEISSRIINLYKAGMSLERAVDMVLGKGIYEKIVDDLYNALRAKGEARQ